MGLLIRAGFSPKESLQAFQSLFALTIGHAVFHYGRRSDDSYAREAEYGRYSYLALLSPSERPPDEEFAFGLEAMLEGMSRRLVERPDSMG